MFLNERTTRIGALQCLCKKVGNLDKEFDVTLPDGTITKATLCKKTWVFDGYIDLNLVFHYIFSLIITLYSYLIRSMIVALVKC